MYVISSPPASVWHFFVRGDVKRHFFFVRPADAVCCHLDTAMDAVDETGESHANAIYHIKKVRVRNNGDPILGSEEKLVVLGDKTGACMPCFAMDLHIWYVNFESPCNFISSGPQT